MICLVRPKVSILLNRSCEALVLHNHGLFKYLDFLSCTLRIENVTSTILWMFILLFSNIPRD